MNFRTIVLINDGESNEVIFTVLTVSKAGISGTTFSFN